VIPDDEEILTVLIGPLKKRKGTVSAICRHHPS
jgi:hypothetical protein